MFQDRYLKLLNQKVLLFTCKVIQNINIHVYSSHENRPGECEAEFYMIVCRVLLGSHS